MNIKSKLINFFISTHQFKVDKPLETLVQKINSRASKESFSTIRIDTNTYKLQSKISLGVGSINNLIFTPINTKAGFYKVSERETKVILSTEIRVDLVLIVGLSLIGFILLLYFQIFKSWDIPVWLDILVFPVIPLWFRFIYRMQEGGLMEDAERFLRI